MSGVPGAKIYEQCAVRSVLVGDKQRVYAVETDNGIFETPVFVDATGVWCGSLKVKGVRDERIRVACYPCTFTYLHSGPMESVSVDDMPIVTDMDNATFIRPMDGRTLCGGFVEHEIRAIRGSLDDPTAWTIPEPSWDAFYPVLDRLLQRVPLLGDVQHGDLVCGVEAYTPDRFPVLGESAQAYGYYVASGYNGHGLAFAGGVGRLIADWIYGQPDISVAKIDTTRFLDLHTNPEYLLQRTPEVAASTYKFIYPSHQCSTARNLRMLPIYHQQKDAGAVFGELMGFERPLWFVGQHQKGRNAVFVGQDRLVGKPEWFERVAKEYEACRERVGLIDMSSFSKFDMTGNDVVPFLQKLCSANVDRPVGSTIYTGMQNESGGYVTDCTVSRLGDNQYFIIAPTIQQLRCQAWMRKWAQEWGQQVQVQDVTGSYTALDVIGPSSRYLMQDVTGRSMRTTDFPTFSCRELNIGMATGIRAISITHCGELGFVLYVPNEVAQNVYEQVVASGREYSLQHAGYYALRQLRIEKFYVYWGQDIDATVTPVECGRAFRVDFNKDFIGKAALLKQMEDGVQRRFVQLLVDRHDVANDPWPQGGEILFRDGRPVGQTTSAAYGFTLGTQICLGYVQNEQFGVSLDYLNSGNYELDIAGKRFPVRVNLHSPTLPMVSSEHPAHYRPTQ